MSCLARAFCRTGMTAAVFVLAAAVSGSPALSEEKIKGSAAFVESVRKDHIATLVSDEPSVEKHYTVSFPREESLSVTILQTIPFKADGALRYRSIVKTEGKGSLKVGATVVLKEYKARQAVYIGEKSAPAASKFKQKIVTVPDQREMVFVPAGRFYVGADDSDDDESPRHLEYLQDYYIDRTEVSNGEYLLFVRSEQAPMPRAWCGVFPAGEEAKPVIVSYSEAAAFAVWAGKRLPTEQEWEKAANGSRAVIYVALQDGHSAVPEKTVYPWGNTFDQTRCNCSGSAPADKGKEPSTGGASPSPYLPVFSDGPLYLSAYGALHMAGNAQEWTDSWYEPYPNNLHKNYRYGKKYKVLRGGSWYSSRDRVRITSREIGGTPNLDEDVAAGFRCVKSALPQDLVPER